MYARADEYVEAATELEYQLLHLMNEYERRLHAYLVAFARDPELAADCTQDTFLRAFEHLKAGKSINAAWLYKVARNRATDILRKRRWTQAGEGPLALMHAVDAVERVTEARLLFDQLPRRDREVLYLFEVAGFKTDEIGTMLGLRGSAVRQRLLRARERLRKLYGDVQ